jgi:flagellar protein FliO/FliZ
MSGLVQPASPVSVGSLAQLTFSLLLIVALILAMSWLLRRFKRGGAHRGGGALAVIDQIAVGPRERIALVRVGQSQVLVGISAGGVVALTPLAAPIVPDLPNPAAPPVFADRLREFMKRPGGPA